VKTWPWHQLEIPSKSTASSKNTGTFRGNFSNNGSNLRKNHKLAVPLGGIFKRVVLFGEIFRPTGTISGNLKRSGIIWGNFQTTRYY
jgi:hypothetical protein